MIKFRGVIFDCDGTLIDSLGYALESFNYALAQIGEGPKTAAEVKRFFGRAADRIFFGLLRDEQKALSAFEHYFEHQSGLAVGMRLFPGIRNLLEQIHEKKIPMAVVTGRHERDLLAVLAPHELDKFFITLVSDNQLSYSKPHPEGILRAAKIMGIDPKECIYVGDSVTDIQAAHAAGAAGIGAYWDSLADPVALQNERPYLLAKSPDEIWVKVQSALV